MIDSIRTTIDKNLAEYEASLPFGYEQVVNQVVNALEERDDAIVESLRERAGDMGLSSSPVLDALKEVGLVRPVPHVLPSYVTSVPPGVQASIDQIDAQLAEIKRVLGL